MYFRAWLPIWLGLPWICPGAGARGALPDGAGGSQHPHETTTTASTSPRGRLPMQRGWPKMDSKTAKIASKTARIALAATKTAPYALQDGRDSPRWPEDEPALLPKRPLMAPRWPQHPCVVPRAPPSWISLPRIRPGAGAREALPEESQELKTYPGNAGNAECGLLRPPAEPGGSQTHL